MSASEPVFPPDQRAFNAHANAASFVAGCYRGDWAIERVAWPVVDISVAAAPRPGAPDRFDLRCDFSNYPTDAPTATPWDPEGNCRLSTPQRPKGPDAGMVFRVDWEEGRALYCGYDRVALAGHQNWVTDHPRTVWNASRDLTWWVRRIWELLNSDEYEGI